MSSSPFNIFEAIMFDAFQKGLGDCLEGFSAESLRFSVWKGELVLKDLRIKDELLSSVDLPVTVKAFSIGTIAAQVPWKSLGTRPITLLIDRIFILAEPSPYGQSLKDKDIKEFFESMFEQAPNGDSWLDKISAAIQPKVTISNVHISYEDSITESSFVVGVCKNNQKTEKPIEIEPIRAVRVGFHGSWFGSRSTKLKTE
ncbi:hypothetical protein KSP39_PZI017130 [Platanthera zijinensis]|uniref:Chorein N-terminal domain-containing protein n=1 Tax=Platanthera zijinensis TaxID=2320716 RepID=A0AAP0G028_9ASPA